MPKGFMPNQDAALLHWARSFSTAIAEDPERFGLTPELAAGFAVLYSDFAAAMRANDPSGRSRITVAVKNRTRELMKSDARRLVKRIESLPGLTDEQRVALGLTVRSAPKKAITPTSIPDIGIVAVAGHRVTITLSDLDHAGRGKPPSMIGATVFTFAGERPPVENSRWTFAGNTGRTRLDVNFPSELPPGARVWIAACWLNGRLESGALGNPVSTHLQGGGVTAHSATRLRPASRAA